MAAARAVARPGAARRARAPVEVRLPDGRVGREAFRAALTVSAATGRALRLVGVREDALPAGLLRRDLALVEAVRRATKARVSGAAIGSVELELRPTTIVSGGHRVALGNGAPVADAILLLAPVLARADAPSTLTVSGATHVPETLTSDALERAWCPLVSRTGPALSLATARLGFPPVGGGEVRLDVAPAPFRPFDLAPDTADPELLATCTVADVPDTVARRELDALGAVPGLARQACAVRRVEADRSGNVLALEARFPSHVERLEVHGREGLPAEAVAKALVALWLRRVRRGDVLDPDLVAALVLPLALGAGGTLRTRRPGRLVEAAADVARAFGLGPIEWTGDEGGEDDDAGSAKGASVDGAGGAGTLRVSPPVD